MDTRSLRLLRRKPVRVKLLKTFSTIRRPLSRGACSNLSQSTSVHTSSEKKLVAKRTGRGQTSTWSDQYCRFHRLEQQNREALHKGLGLTTDNLITTSGSQLATAAAAAAAAIKHPSQPLLFPPPPPHHHASYPPN